MTSKTGSPSKALLFLLAISLAVNLLLAGLWVGAKLSGKERSREHNRVEFNMRGLRDAIQGDKAREFRRVLRTQMGDVRARMEAQREMYNRLGEALTAETVDVELVGSLLAEQRAYSGEFKRPMHEALLAVLPQMTVEERKKLVEALAAQRPRYRSRRQGPEGGERMRKRHPDGPPPEAGTF